MKLRILTSVAAAAVLAGSPHDKMGQSHPKLARGQVWCRTCRRTQHVDSAECLRTGWPKCCGATMTIDPPEEWS